MIGVSMFAKSQAAGTSRPQRMCNLRRTSKKVDIAMSRPAGVASHDTWASVRLQVQRRTPREIEVRYRDEKVDRRAEDGAAMKH